MTHLAVVTAEEGRTRLVVHAHARTRRLMGALETNYPVLASVLGEAAFAALGAAYVEAHPARFYSIRWYGDGLPQFLAGHADYAPARVLADLARWEWALTELLDAVDAEPLSAALLECVPAKSWTELRFDLHPSVRMLELQWNVPAIWQSLAGDTQSDMECTGEGVWPAPALADETQAWLLWRGDLQIHYRALRPIEAAALEYCRRGHRLGEIPALAAQWLNGPVALTHMNSVLRRWVDSGLIVRARLC